MLKQVKSRNVIFNWGELGHWTIWKEHIVAEERSSRWFVSHRKIHWQHPKHTEGGSIRPYQSSQFWRRNRWLLDPSSTSETPASWPPRPALTVLSPTCVAGRVVSHFSSFFGFVSYSLWLFWTLHKPFRPGRPSPCPSDPARKLSGVVLKTRRVIVQ